uniref:Uncharacterized protein n=1 Tax=Physcomitrium patens TaxID=3218 RepID=A0A2K1KK42_PHYPA|nr:hypothetical protein PHYPA_007824 [Physcomitrium patens]PNR54151.1 hypothetical protein PHYPA_007827 [Physcomitrium patens]PNR54154.1 hypothetical protein PHYPA_007830 [Physcomitrium patens]
MDARVATNSSPACAMVSSMLCTLCMETRTPSAGLKLGFAVSFAVEGKLSWAWVP